MLNASNLSEDEQRIISELTDKLIGASNEEKINREELFSRLSTLVEGVKLGLVSKDTTAQATAL